MKLLKKYRTYTYTSLLFAILIGFLSNYFLFKGYNHRTADEVIKEYRNDIEEYAEAHGTLRPLMQVNSKFGKIQPVDQSYDLDAVNQHLGDTLAYDHYQDDIVIYRKMYFPVVAADGKYLVRLMLPTMEKDMLIGTVITSLLIFTVLFILLTSIIDRSFSRHIFHPFNTILEAIKNYDIEKTTEVLLLKSDIDEFQDLKRILTQMINKINERYYEMKEFLEYTSHELQTPLSIMQLKLETLNQKNFDDPEVIESISSIQSALRRVVRFNRSILLIAKIRNGQFAEKRNINLRILFSNQIKQFDEILTMKNLTLSLKKKEDFTLELNPLLAEHLVQNLLTNAIKHNFDGGKIEILSYKNRMIIANTYKGKIPEGDLFEKYKHSSGKRDSSGLGLAIVKTICLKNDIGIGYRTEGELFIMCINRNRTSSK